MTTEWKPKPVAEIPRDLANSLWGGLDGDALEVCFWVGDDEAGLHLMLSQDEIKEIENYGVTDELIEWMRDNEMFKIETTPTLNDTIEDYESFIITDEIVARFYAT